jgi:pilus assembly protein CpaB
MKPQQFIMLIVALGCGLGAMVMTQKYLKKDVAKTVETAPVVVAATNIAPGQVIGENMIKVSQIEKTAIPEGAVADPNEVIGKSVRYPLSERQIFVQSAFALGGGKGIAAVLEAGKRALTVPTSADRAVAGFIKPNDHVDIILNVKQRGADQAATSKIILQDVRVLAVDTSMNNDGVRTDQGAIVEMVTFLVTPEESELLTLAQNAGTLSLVLRNPGDIEVVKTKGASLEKVLAGDDSEEVSEPEPEKFFVENQKSGGASGGLLGLLTNIVAKQEKQEEQEAEAQVEQPEPVVQVEPIPQEPKKQQKWLVYRDLEGNELMRVLVDADSDIAARLKDQLEDVELGEQDGNAGGTNPAVNTSPVAFPGKRS